MNFIDAIALRLSNYNPVEKRKIIEQTTYKELYEAYLMYAFDNFPDA